MPASRPGYVQGVITNTYLSAAEYDLLASLPAAVLSKTRGRDRNLLLGDDSFVSTALP